MSIILNKEDLKTNKLRGDALDILEAGFSAINTEKILRKKISFKDGTLCINDKNYKCSLYERIFFIGIGKCAFDGAKIIEEMLGDSLTDGIVLDVKYGELKKIKSFEGTHPYPSETNVSVTKKIVEMVSNVTERDLVLVLISGGGSSLLCLPHGINYQTLIEVTRTLTKNGADIFELNAVRKHLSEIQGGQLAKMCYPAEVVSLIFSDVLGDDIGVVASGPTVPDRTTIEDASNILSKYGILGLCIPPDCSLMETPKEEKYFEKVRNILVATNEDALLAMKEKALGLGYNTNIESRTLSGNATEVGIELAKKELEHKTCLLFGGETTVKIKGGGFGGRNQEVALSALPFIKEEHILISSASDGWDNTEYAGAITDKDILNKSFELNLNPQEFLDKNDSYNFYKKVGGQIITGRLGVNVSDLFILIRD
jgi:glycerate 2-kinase